MRPWGDDDMSRLVQASRPLQSSCEQAGFDLKLVIEDDRRNVEMFRREGIPCLYKHSGYYD